MNMKQGFLIVLFVILKSSTMAQQKPHYTQYILNQYIINPALTGIENYTDIKLSHRHQWKDIDGSPVTTYFTIQGPIEKKTIVPQLHRLQCPVKIQEGNPIGKII